MKKAPFANAPFSCSFFKKSAKTDQKIFFNYNDAHKNNFKYDFHPNLKLKQLVIKYVLQLTVGVVLEVDKLTRLGVILLPQPCKPYKKFQI